MVCGSESHQIGNRRFTATRFREPGPEGVTQTIPDPLHSEEEDRFVVLGQSGLQHTLVVVQNYRGEVIRIISARIATSRERRDYERGKE